ncbi:MAG: DUF6776 family protein [bacterium]
MAKVRVRPVLSPRIHQPDDPWRPVWVVAFVLLLGWLAWQIFEIGRQRGGYDHDRAVRQKQALQTLTVEQQQEISQLSQEVARYRRSSEIDSAAVRKSQVDMTALLNERADLKREVGFLRGLVSSDSGPLYIRDFQLELEAENKYRFSFTIAQALENTGLTRGKLKPVLVGTLNGKAAELTESQFSERDKDERKLEFRNYQEIEGVFSLPPEFTPELFRIDVIPKSKKIRAFSKEQSWQDFFPTSQQIEDL